MDYIKYFEKKYPHLDKEDIELLEGQAKEILIHLLFKSQYKITDAQKEYAYEEYKYWILRCMQEMVERAGMTSAIAYKENGISITFSQEQLSLALRNEIVPIVGVQ